MSNFSVTLPEIARGLLAYIDDGDPVLEAGMPAGTGVLISDANRDAIARSVNGALDEIRRRAPGFSIRSGAILHAPVPVTVSLPDGASGDLSLLDVSAVPSWACPGQSIQIAGDWHAILAIGEDQISIAPKTDISASTAATWHCDAVALPSPVLGDLVLDSGLALIPAGSPERLRASAYGWERWPLRSGDYGERPASARLSDGYPTVGQPVFWCQEQLSGTGAILADSAKCVGSNLLLRVGPIPSSRHTLSWRCDASLYRVSGSDIHDEAITIDLGGVGLSVDDILFPLAAQRWFASPWVRVEEAISRRVDDWATRARLALDSLGSPASGGSPGITNEYLNT